MINIKILRTHINSKTLLIPKGDQPRIYNFLEIIENDSI